MGVLEVTLLRLKGPISHTKLILLANLRRQLSQPCLGFLESQYQHSLGRLLT
jgi:hypothetical protein